MNSSNPKKVKIGLLEELASCWQDRGLPFAVANGLHDYPREIGRDIDVVFHKKNLPVAVAETIGFFKKRGFRVLPYQLGWLHWIIAFREKGGIVESVQVDLFDHLQWGFAWVLDGLEEGGKKKMLGPFQIDPWASVGKRVFLNGLSGNFEIFRKKPWYLETNIEERASMKDHMIRLAGRDFPALRAAIVSGNQEDIRAGFVSFRAAVFRCSFLSPSGWFHRMWGAWIKQYCFNLNPPVHVPAIRIVGWDREEVDRFAGKLAVLVKASFPFPLRFLNEEILTGNGFLSHFKTRHSVKSSSALLEIVILKAVGAVGRPPFLPRSMSYVDLNIERDSPQAGLDQLVGWFKKSSHCVEPGPG